MTSESQKVWRRLRSARGTAYLEFAVMAPFFLFAFFFAADFTRLLYCEQQVEIATRALCDIESHLQPGYRDEGTAGSGCPGWNGKRVVRRYLSEALAKEGLYHHHPGDSGEDAVYCKGGYSNQEGILHYIVNKILGAMTPGEGDTNKFISLLKGAFGGFVNLMTLRTIRYVQDVIPTDKVVRTSVSVLVQPVMPNGFYTFFGRHHSQGAMLVPTVTPRLAGGRDLTQGKRVRYYCHMPSMDTAAVAPPTYVRKLSKVFPKSWFSWD